VDEIGRHELLRGSSGWGSPNFHGFLSTPVIMPSSLAGVHTIRGRPEFTGGVGVTSSLTETLFQPSKLISVWMTSTRMT
jgi:hypothetical protein